MLFNLLSEFPRGLDAANPLDDHPLNVGRVLWLLSNAGGHSSYYGGNKWFDLTPKKNNGTLTNESTWVGAMGRRGGWGGLSCFRPGSRYVDCSSSTLSITSGTVGLWVYSVSASQDGYAGLFSGMEGGGGSQGYCVILDGSTQQVSLWVDNVKLGVDPDTLAVNEWVRVVAAWNNSSSSIYINGANVVTGAGGTPTNSSNTKYIAQYAGVYFDGIFDDVSVWNRVLTASEVAQDYELSQQGYPGVLRCTSSIKYFFKAGEEVVTTLRLLSLTGVGK